MTDKTTATKAPAKKATADSDNSAKINDLLAQVRDLMVEDGADPATAQVLVDFARPGSPQIVGNLADLQRMGAIAITGTMPTPPGVDDIKTSDVNDAFVEPPAPAAVPAQDLAQISADAFKADEAKAKK